MKILIADDDAVSRRLLEKTLERAGYEVTAVENGRQAVEHLVRHDTPRLALLDWMMPELDGTGVCREVRTRRDHGYVYMILLTSKESKEDMVIGLKSGADDYLTKPFDQRELLARVKAVLRRTAEKAAAPTRSETRPVLCFGGWRLDVARRELRSADNTLVLLSGGEFDLLLAFAEHPQRVLTRDQLIDFARGSMHVAYDRSIDVQVSRLRYKLEEDPKNPELIRTVRNGGYIFAPVVTRG